MLKDLFVVSRLHMVFYRDSCTTQVWSLDMLGLLVSRAQHALHPAYLLYLYPSPPIPHPVTCCPVLGVLTDNKVGATNGNQRGVDGFLDIRIRGGTYARRVRVSTKGQAVLQVRGHLFPSLETECKRARVIEGNEREERKGVWLIGGAEAWAYSIMLLFDGHTLKEGGFEKHRSRQLSTLNSECTQNVQNVQNADRQV